MWENWWPTTNMDLLVLMQSMVFQQRLQMLPARQSSDSANRRIHNIVQARAGRVTENSPFHVRRLQLSSPHLDLSVRSNGALRDVERVFVVLGHPEGDREVVLGHASPDSVHLRRVATKRVLNITGREVKVNRAAPDARQ